MKLHIIVFLVTVFYSLPAHSQTEINRAVLTDTEMNSKVGARSSICLNVYFGDGQENKNEADFKRKVKKHQVGFDINYWVKDAERTNSFRVLNYDLRDYHLLLVTDYYWDCAKFNDLLSSQTPSINYSFKNVRVSEDSTKFEYLLMKNEGHCQLSGDFEVFFPIIELILKEQEVSMLSSNRLLERRLKSSDDMVKSLSNELKKIDAANEDLKKSLAEIKSNLDNSNNEGGKLKIQLSYLPELGNTQLSNQALSAKLLLRIKKSPMSIAFGYGQAGREWKSGTSNYYKQSLSNNGNIPMDIVTQGTEVTDKYSLKFNAALLGFAYDINRLKIGLDFWVPIKSSLTSENVTGMFDYYGISNQVLEPIVDIPSLGLVSNVSYTGDKFVFQNVVKSRGAVHLGYEMDVLKNMSILPSLYFMSKSTLKNISNAENLTNGYGQYSGLVQYSESERKLSSVLYLNLSVCFKITK